MYQPARPTSLLSIRHAFPLRLPQIISLFTLLALIILGAGCGRAINRSAERRIRDILPNILGPARQYRVHIDNDANRTVRGHLSHVTIDGDDVQFLNGMLIDALHLDLRGVDVDTKKKYLRSIQQAHFSATIGQATLDEILAGEAPEGETLRNTRVTLGANNLVTLSSERVVLGVGVPFNLTGTLSVTGPRRLEMDPRHLSVVGIGIAGKPLQFLKNRFERAIDVSTLPFPVTLTGVSTTQGKITLEGDADVTDLIRRAQER